MNSALAASQGFSVFGVTRGRVRRLRGLAGPAQRGGGTVAGGLGSALGGGGVAGGGGT
jgi:hypothetical protein